jgi:hypothetical protein
VSLSRRRRCSSRRARCADRVGVGRSSRICCECKGLAGVGEGGVACVVMGAPSRGSIEKNIECAGRLLRDGAFGGRCAE